MSDPRWTKAVLPDFVQNEGVVLGPKSVGDVGRGFTAMPVTPLTTNGAGWTDDLCSAGLSTGGAKWKRTLSKEEACCDDVRQREWGTSPMT